MHERPHHPGVTRRDIIRIAVGALMTLPSVTGGFVVLARQAFAEAGGGQTLLVAYLDRIAEAMDALVAADDEAIVSKVCFLLVDVVGERLFVPDRQAIDEALAPLHSATVHDLALLPPTTVRSEDGSGTKHSRASSACRTYALRKAGRSRSARRCVTRPPWRRRRPLS